jgi:hypothetical protein
LKELGPKTLNRIYGRSSHIGINVIVVRKKRGGGGVGDGDQGGGGGGGQGKVAKEQIAKEKRKALNAKSQPGTQHRHPRGKSLHI